MGGAAWGWGGSAAPWLHAVGLATGRGGRGRRTCLSSALQHFCDSRQQAAAAAAALFPHTPTFPHAALQAIANYFGTTVATVKRKIRHTREAIATHGIASVMAPSDQRLKRTHHKKQARGLFGCSRPVGGLPMADRGAWGRGQLLLWACPCLPKPSSITPTFPHS